MTELQNELLAFGTKFPSPSGASYYLGSDGEPMKDRPLEIWITCRMAHVYSIGAALGFEGAGELADQGLKGIRGILTDTQNGGWYPGVTKEQKPLPEKQCYAHAFVMLAAASTLLMERPGAEELLKRSTEIFLDKFWDDEEGLSVDTWNTEFTVLEPYRGLNANMHSVEAFLALADVTHEEIWRQRAGRIIAHMSRPQFVGGGGRSQRKTGMPGIGFLNHVGRQHTDRIYRFLVNGAHDTSLRHGKIKNTRMRPSSSRWAG